MFGIDDILIAAAISSVAAGGASIIGGQMANESRENTAYAANAWGQAMQQESFRHQDRMAAFNAEQARMTREWQEGMSNTSYRRAMNDMRLAGLNPILAYAQGGATTPTGATGSGQGGATASPGAKADVENIISPAVSNAFKAAEAVAGVQQASANISNTQANTQLLEQEVRLRKEQQEQARASTAESVARTITEGHRAGFVKNQTASEAMMPALRAAETAAASAAAGEASARTEGHNLENTRTRNYGPRSSAADALANAEAVARRAAGATPGFRDGLDRIMQGMGGQGGYSGPRAIPSGPSRPPRYIDDPYGLR